MKKVLLAAAALACMGGTALAGPNANGSLIVALADGDLDGDERGAMLRRVVQLGETSKDPRGKWAGLLAAVALEDEGACAAALRGLGGTEEVSPTVVPPEAARGFLDLADPMLGNLGRAWWAEAAGEPEQARVLWGQVAAEARLSAAPLASKLAGLALGRLR